LRHEERGEEEEEEETSRRGHTQHPFSLLLLSPTFLPHSSELSVCSIKPASLLSVFFSVYRNGRYSLLFSVLSSQRWWQDRLVQC